MNNTIELTIFQFLVLATSLLFTGAMIPDDHLRRLRVPAAIASLTLIYMAMSGVGR